MRRSLLIFTLLMVGGCAARSGPQQQSQFPTRIEAYDNATVASALVFDPPVISNQPAPDLSRDDRGIAAFAGYDEGITTFFYLRINDRQLLDDHDRGQYERRAVSET